MNSSILIVEDEAVVAEDLAQKVINLGYRVLKIAPTGEAALEISQTHPPDLILLDVTLAGKLDGIETATRLKEFSDIPFIFLTAHSDPETIKRATAAGSSGYVLKPFREADLEVQLRSALYMSERKKTERKLRKTEDLLLRAQHGAQAGVWEIDLRTDRITWSEPYYDLFGIPRSTEPSIAAWLSSIHAEDREQVLASYRQSLEEKRNQSMEFRIVKPNGEVRWIHRQGQVEVDEEGKAIRINGISFDITERKRAEEVWRKSEDRYRRLYESIDEGFCIIQVVFDAHDRAVDFVFLEVNPSFEKQSGIQDAQGRSMRQIAPHHEEHWFEMYGHIALTGQSKRFEYPAVELHRWYQGYAYRIGDESERKVAIIFNDITDRKQAEEALKAIALFPAQNPSPVLRISQAGILLYMNTVSNELLRGLQLQQGQLVPLDLQDVVQQTLNANACQQTEYALQSSHYLITIVPVSESAYANLYWTDITERKRVEDALQTSEEKYRYVFETVGTSIFEEDWTDIRKLLDELRASGVTDLLTYLDAHPDVVTHAISLVKITDVNDYTLQLFRAPSKEALLGALDRIFVPETTEVFKEELVAVWEGRNIYRGHASVQTMEGEKLSVLFTLVAPKGNVDWKRVTVTVTDVTALHHVEAALRDSEARLQSFAGQLEQLVEERTQELVQSQERLRAMAKELNLAEQRERKHLATELHDHLQQLLVLGKLRLAQLKRESNTPPAVNMIADTDKMLTEALSYTRTLVAELSPLVLRDHGLSAGLKWLEEYMRKYHLDVTVHVSHAHLSVAEDQALLLFQSVRELLINCSKYAETSEAWVHATMDTDQLTIEVKDKGKGFTLDAKDSAKVSPNFSPKFGLLSIRERMHALGGSFELTSSPGHGTTAVLRLPLSQRAGSMEVLGEASSEVSLPLPF